MLALLSLADRPESGSDQCAYKASTCGRAMCQMVKGGAPRHAVGASGMGVMALAMSIHSSSWSTFRLAVLVLLLLMLVAISVLTRPALWACHVPDGQGWRSASCGGRQWHGSDGFSHVDSFQCMVDFQTS